MILHVIFFVVLIVGGVATYDLLKVGFGICEYSPRWYLFLAAVIALLTLFSLAELEMIQDLLEIPDIIDMAVDYFELDEVSE